MGARESALEDLDLKMLKDFYRGKKVFITGDTGFKGAWLAYWLCNLGAEITGFALPPHSKTALFNLLELNKKIHHIEGDICDQKTLSSALQESQAELVFHLAAQALVRKSYEEPLLTFQTNIMGSANLLESIRQVESVKSLVYITSDKCYWNHGWSWGYRETDALGGADPYSASKACAELIFKSYYLSYFRERENFGCASTRAGNVIGGGDRSKNRVIPDIVQAIENKKPVIIRNPHATRPWQHVLDPLCGYLKLGMKLYEDTSFYKGEAWNFGPSNNSIKTVNDITIVMKQIWPELRVEYQEDIHQQPEAQLLHLSIDKVQSLLKWSPKISFDNAVLKTADWYQRVKCGEDPKKVTKEQIQVFMYD